MNVGHDEKLHWDCGYLATTPLNERRSRWKTTQGLRVSSYHTTYERRSRWETTQEGKSCSPHVVHPTVLDEGMWVSGYDIMPKLISMFALWTNEVNPSRCYFLQLVSNIRRSHCERSKHLNGLYWSRMFINPTMWTVRCGLWEQRTDIRNVQPI